MEEYISDLSLIIALSLNLFIAIVIAMPIIVKPTKRPANPESPSKKNSNPKMI